MEEGGTHTQETKDKIRRARTGAHHSEGTKAKISGTLSQRRLESALYRAKRAMRSAAGRHGEGELDFE